MWGPIVAVDGTALEPVMVSVVVAVDPDLQVRSTAKVPGAALGGTKAWPVITEPSGNIVNVPNAIEVTVAELLPSAQLAVILTVEPGAIVLGRTRTDVPDVPPA